MNMGLKAAFMFVAPEADAAKHQAVIETPIVELTVVGVKNYADAVAAAKKLVNQGIVAIEFQVLLKVFFFHGSCA